MGTAEEEEVKKCEADFCDCLVHPFQNDPGVSQLQRVMDELLDTGPKIDPRKTADLLDYFQNLSKHVNYYDLNLNVSDWQPFFARSKPFILASIIKYNANVINEKFELYKLLFKKNPSKAGLRLSLLFIFCNTIKQINSWHLRLKEINSQYLIPGDSDLPIERTLENIIKDKLQAPLKKFICLHNVAAKYYCIPPINFEDLLSNDILKLSGGDLAESNSCINLSFFGRKKRIVKLHDEIINTFSSFHDAIKILSAAAELSLEQSFFPLKEELKKQHTPHLALLFAFLKLFKHLQSDLNTFTKKHLDFFYKDVLKLKPKEAIPDKVHIVFEIQKELKEYLLKKGLNVKDGKDINKQEIFFSLDEEIVINKAQVKDVRTLFLNNQIIPDPDPAHPSGHVNLLEGVYFAPDATKADGIDKDFQTDIKNYYTVGNKESKYILPGTNVFKPYPNARLGFILASPVLLLNEGTRTVTITLDCSLDPIICEKLGLINNPSSDKCCGKLPAVSTGIIEKTPYFLPFPFDDTLNNLYTKVITALGNTYYYVGEEILQQLAKNGISNDLINKLRDNFLTLPNEDHPANDGEFCYCPVKRKLFDATIISGEFELKIIESERELIKEFIKPRKPLKLLFSGEKEWIETNKDNPVSFAIAPSGFTTSFTLTITAVLTPELKAVTFYNKENLKEDLDTELPLVKIELDDKIKLPWISGKKTPPPCCLEIPVGNDLQISLYHFFRNVKVEAGTQIDVQVCGLKSFIVQNDESVMDVNSIVLPFGSRPKKFSNFYIGCPEIFCKNWIKASIDFTWKDKPFDLKAYYHGYEDVLLNIKQEDFDEEKFEYNSAILSDGNWYENNSIRKLFKTELNTECGNYSFKIDTCATPLFNSDGWVRLSCVKESFINIECIKSTCIDTDGSILPAFIDTTHRFVIHTAFKPNFIDPTNTFIDYNCILNGRYSYVFLPGNFNSFIPSTKDEEFFKKDFFTNNSRNGFLKLTLVNQDFQHDRYSFVLTRQMMALGKFPDVYVGPVYDGITVTGSKTISVMKFDDLFKAIEDSLKLTQSVNPRLKNIIDAIRLAYPGGFPIAGPFNVSIDDFLARESMGDPYPGVNIPPTTIIADTDVPPLFLNVDLDKILKFLEDSVLSSTKDKIDNIKDIRVVIPNEPYVPKIQGMALDYIAKATIQDITLIHLYPYENTHKLEEIQLKPTLFPTFCDEGTLFIGLENLVPGNNLNILFQLAEATGDSEADKEIVHWLYLDNNVWKPLRKGFEVVNDATENLTTSGIVKFALPENMTNQNSVMPKNLHWIKATIPQNSKSVSETIGIHTQAIRATFTNNEANDKLRLSSPLAASQISKLEEADASVKKVSQPYDSFDGTVPEEQELFYVRASELLRHKGRTIQKFDYERIVLDAFPQIFKTKCINHSFGLNAHQYKNDFPYAPGYVLLAAIPDLNKLKAGNAFEPKVPMSILEKIDAYIRKRTSPFVRFRAMNPRYEKIHICIKVKLFFGKDENYYKEKLKEDFREFLAPWAVGEFHKIAFGQCVNRSDIIRFLESRDYLDFILELSMRHETETVFPRDKDGNRIQQIQICPKTPRSILIAGDIDVCIDPKACEQWGICKKITPEGLPIEIDCCDQKEEIIQYCKPPRKNG